MPRRWRCYVAGHQPGGIWRYWDDQRNPITTNPDHRFNYETRFISPAQDMPRSARFVWITEEIPE